MIYGNTDINAEYIDDVHTYNTMNVLKGDSILGDVRGRRYYAAVIV